jgi:prephenate dehydrogenase
MAHRASDRDGRVSVPVVEKVAVIGLGLLGGSVAAAAHARRAAKRVVGVARSRTSPAFEALRGCCDEVSTDPAAGVRGAELVVLATPIGVMADVLRAAGPGFADGCVVTDVGSVKGVLAETLPGLLPPGVHYVGAHPMAGSHERGPGAARADLLEGAPCIVTAAAGAPAWAAERVEAFFAALGARVLRRDPARHDDEVGWVSHLPHALAFAYARALADAPESAAQVRGSGFRDFTRIAKSDPELWAEILCANRKALAGPLGRAAARLGELARAIEQGDAEAVERFLATARDTLARAAETPDPGAKPEIIPVKGSKSTHDR